MNAIYEISIKYRTPETRRIEKIAKGCWIDLACDEDVYMNAGEFRIIHLGIAMALPDGIEAHIVPRSSTYKNFKVLQVNSYGIVDTSYRGENDWWMFPALSFENTYIPRGSRICQFRLMEIQPEIIFHEVNFLGNPDRGGFGTTGIN